MFVWYNENPRGNYFAGDCVIRAISIVIGDSWDDIYDELCDKGKYIGDWGNNNGVWDSYLRQRGFKRYICPNDCPYCYSIKDFANEHPKGSYIVATGTHAVAVEYVSGITDGTTVPTPVIDQINGRLKINRIA